MKLMRSMMISCRKATYLAAQKGERKLSFGEHLHLIMHLSMCRFCRLFERQSAYVNRQVSVFTPSSRLLQEEKDRIQHMLENHS